jgi:deoxyribodipyrimidine photo-lyase
VPVNPKRAKKLAQAEEQKGPVIYWMSRDQRVYDNWALLFAIELAQTNNSPMAVAFCLSPQFLGATSRQYPIWILSPNDVQKEQIIVKEKR